MEFPLSKLKGVGPKRLKALEAAGIRDMRDLLTLLPAAYRDLDNITPVAELREGDMALARVRVVGGASLTAAGKLTIVRASVGDETGTIAAVWYNQPWIKNKLSPGEELKLYGRVERRLGCLQLNSPTFERGGGLQPVYSAVPGIPKNILKKIIRGALDAPPGQWPDELPEALRSRYGLCERGFAVYSAHQPIDAEAAQTARRRLAFEELLLYQVGLWIIRGGRERGARTALPIVSLDAYWGSLPFAPTAAQRRAAEEALSDMRSGYAMARMVQGDVGSGKTAVAFAAIYAAVKSGWQAALMAPTEILAAQHYKNAQKMLSPHGITCGLLTGSIGAKQRRLAYEAIKNGEWRLAIGTHALITEGVEYAALGLVVTDEQHRFGVRQRSRLSEKGGSPHVLVMSATPIPRTMSLILYGDLDISIIDELPPGRKPVRTNLVPELKRRAMYSFIRSEAAKGGQAYIVCPLVEESEETDALAAEMIYDQAIHEEALSGLRVGLAHGRMKAAEKEAALQRFLAGELDILVSTTIIEVGVDAPNATIMVIENAERFGLAQLHQLRGRVGRGGAQSWCFLMAEPSERLSLLARTSDGFEIAEKDLELRGPGDITGYRQSGSTAHYPLSAMGDAKLLKETHDAAREIIHNSEAPESKTVIRLARGYINNRFKAIALN